MKKNRIAIFLLITLIIGIFFYSPVEIKKINKKVEEIITPKTSSSHVTFKFGTDAGPHDLDPHNAWDYDSWNVIDQVIETLFAYDLSSPELNIIPRLASGYGTWSVDGLRYFVPIREGVTFHDGSMFDKSAVIWNFDRLNYLMNSHAEPSQLSSLYSWPDGTPIINSVNIYNSTHIQFVLNRKFAPFEALLCVSGSGIMSPLSTPAEDYIDLLTGELVGTGPFEYNEYIENVEVRFQKYDNYWRGAADIDELIFSIIPDSQDRTQALLDGEVDFINIPDRTKLQELRDNLEITLGGSHSDATIRYLGMNNQLIPVYMRKAISYAVDYYRIIEELMNGEAVRLKSPIPLGIRYFNWGFNVPQTNIITAREALIDSGMYSSLPGLYDDQGWINRANTNPLAVYNFSYWWQPDDPRMVIKNILQENLEKIGVIVLEEIITWEEFLRRATEDKDLLELFYTGWVADYNDPYDYINPLFSSDGNWNLAQVNDATVQGWIDSAESELDPGVRESLYDDIQRRLVEEVFPWCWLFVARNYDAFNNRFGGYQSNPLDKVWFYSVYVLVTHVKSNWLVNEVTLDGIMSAGEWDESIAYTVALNHTWGWPNPQTEVSGKELTIRFKNDEDWLYMLYEIPKSQLESKPEYAVIGFFWWYWTYSDSGWVGLSGGTMDRYGWNGVYWQDDALNHVEGTGSSSDSLYYRFEFRKMLDSADGQDWSLWPGEGFGSPEGNWASRIDHVIVHLFDVESQSIYDHYISLQLSRRHIISNWLTNGVTLDGIISLGEWTDAIPYDIPLYRAGGWPTPFHFRSNKVPTIRFKNDGEWLYGLYEIEWLGPENPPEVAGIGSSGFFGNPRTQSDGASVGIGGWTDDRYGFDGYLWYLDTEVSGQNDMEGMGVIDGNYYRFEFRKRLDSNDGWDWDVSPGGTLGDPFGPPWLWVTMTDWDTGITYIQYLMLQLTSGTIQVSSDFTLTSDIYFGVNAGFEIVEDAITLNGNGHKIIGSGSGTGVIIINQNYVSVKNLTVQGFFDGIAIYGGEQNEISVNYISDNLNTGILLSSTQNEVTNNIITRNNVGVAVNFTSNYIYRNLLINNGFQIADVYPGTNFWYDADNEIGNFWSNYWGEDDGSGGRIAGDYIGDTQLPHEEVDYYPLMDPSIPEQYGPLPYADAWMIGHGGSPVIIHAVDPYGRIITADVNEIGLNAFYIENEEWDPGEASIMILIAIDPEAPITGTYTIEITATEDTTYSLQLFTSAVGEILLEQSFENVPLDEGNSDTIGTVVQEVEDPVPGEPPVTAKPGDVIRKDIYAPTVYISQPGSSEQIWGSSVYVEGTATDDSGVLNVTVNGVEIEFTSTYNPDDPNEVTFNTMVEDLELGKNAIIINVTDNTYKSTIVKRFVFRDAEITFTGPIEPLVLGTSCDITGDFTDLDLDETHNATWDWGDDTTSEGTVDQTNDIVIGSHIYNEPGVYIVTLTIEDSVGESETAVCSQYIIVYDPSQGFVTGGGWIDSPEDAYPADPGLCGIANFGFVARYNKGIRIPTGNTEFMFHAGDLNFHSDTYDWLTIAGAKAIFKGIGTINGEGSYNFILTAIDGELVGGGAADSFRIKIWIENEETGEEIIIYDNGLGDTDNEELDGTTEIGGGSIMIHNSPK